jgi:hypothetical protein
MKNKALIGLLISVAMFSTMTVWAVTQNDTSYAWLIGRWQIQGWATQYDGSIANVEPGIAEFGKIGNVIQGYYEGSEHTPTSERAIITAEGLQWECHDQKFDTWRTVDYVNVSTDKKSIRFKWHFYTSKMTKLDE